MDEINRQTANGYDIGAGLGVSYGAPTRGHNMACLVKRPGLRAWYIVWWQGGRQRWRSTGTENLDLAQRALAELEAILCGRKRTDRIRALLETAARVDVAEVRLPLDLVWSEYRRLPGPALCPRYLAARERRWIKFAEWLAVAHPEVQFAGEVTARIGLEYLESLSVAGQTRNSYLSDLRSIWATLLVPWALVQVWRDVPRGQAQHITRRALTVEQVKALYAAALRHRNPFWPAAVALGYHTGLRWGDVCTLSWDEIDIHEGSVCLVPRKSARGGRRVTLPLPAEVLGLLPEPRGSTGPVWLDVDRSYRSASPRMGKELRELFASVGIKMRRESRAGERGKVVQEYGFHSLRHTYVTLLEDADVSREDVQSLVGHGSPIMTAHYSHSRGAARRSAGKLPCLAAAKGGK